jgi:hypothetical protein
MDFIKRKPSTYTNLKKHRITEEMLDSADIDKLEIAPLLFQTGYLTIADTAWSGVTLEYLLDMPNHEVKRSFNLHVLSALTESGDVWAAQTRTSLVSSFLTGDLNDVLNALRGLFASIPYNLHVELEAYYHSIFYAVMNVLGLDMNVEVSVSKGRVDAVIEMNDKVYVMELKYMGCKPDAGDEEKMKLRAEALEKGMAQIHEKEYYKKYLGIGKTVYLAAFAFLGRDDIDMQVSIM